MKKSPNYSTPQEMVLRLAYLLLWKSFFIRNCIWMCLNLLVAIGFSTNTVFGCWYDGIFVLINQSMNEFDRLNAFLSNSERYYPGLLPNFLKRDCLWHCFYNIIKFSSPILLLLFQKIRPSMFPNRNIFKSPRLIAIDFVLVLSCGLLIM